MEPSPRFVTAVKMPAKSLFVGIVLLAAHLFASSQASVVPTSMPAAITSASYTEEDKSSCICAVELPPVIVCTDHEARENAIKLKLIQQQFSKLTLDVEQLQEVSVELQALGSSFRGKLAEVTATFELIEAGSILVTRSLLEEVRQGIRKLEEYMQAWQTYGIANRGLGQIDSVLQELSNVNQTLDLMEAQGTSESLPAVQQRIASLNSQLESCRAQTSGEGAGHQSPTTPDVPVPVERQTTGTVNVATTVATPTRYAQTAARDMLPEKWPIMKRKQNSCGRLVRIMEPYTVRHNLAAGTWMRDPIVETDSVYFQSFPSDSDGANGQLHVSASLKVFQTGATSEVSLPTVDYLKDSVMFNGSMYAFSGDSTERARSHHYYQDRNQADRRPTLHKIDRSKLGASSSPTTSSIDVRRVITTSDLKLDRAAYRASTVVPKADLTLDESGVWVLYSDSQSSLAAAKLDPDTLEVSQTWEGSFPTSQLGNCFVACGRVYCVGSRSDFAANVSYFMDTVTNTEGFVRVPMMLKYGSLSSLEYNPADQLLYGIDGGHAVVYELVFQD